MMPNVGSPMQSAIKHAREANHPVLDGGEYVLALDAFVRSVGVKRSSPHALFLGAGASITSGMPSAEKCIWEWKRQIFLTNNPGLEEQFSELSLEGVRRRIQRWLDQQGAYPKEGSPEEYGFYIQQCFPLGEDRRAFFAERVRSASPHIGYHLLCQLAETALFRSVWTPNFDGLAARAAGRFKLTPVEIGVDSQNRIGRATARGELLCVSMHGDYRYDRLKNTSEELQAQESALRTALQDEARDASLIVCGYSGRDESLMEALSKAYSEAGTGVLYWCGFGDEPIPQNVAGVLHHARRHGRQAQYVSTFGFDDLMVRLALHCLDGEERGKAVNVIDEFTSEDKLTREPFQIRSFSAATLIKSNAFPIECPSEMLQFALQQWPPKGEAWSYIRKCIEQREVAAVPFKGRVFALGTIDDVKEAFADNIKGSIERVPVAAKDLAYEDGAIVSLMRDSLTRSIQEMTDLPSERNELWKRVPRKKVIQSNVQYHAFDSVQIYLRRVGGVQYLVLKPSIKVLSAAGDEAPLEIANPIKLGILGYQHNKEFNQAVNEWRELILAQQEPAFEFPSGRGSSFKFRVKRSPVFGEIGLPQGGATLRLSAAAQRLVKYKGVQIAERACQKFCVRGGFHVRELVNRSPYRIAN